MKAIHFVIIGLVILVGIGIFSALKPKPKTFWEKAGEKIEKITGTGEQKQQDDNTNSSWWDRLWHRSNNANNNQPQQSSTGDTAYDNWKRAHKNPVIQFPGGNSQPGNQNGPHPDALHPTSGFAHLTASNPVAYAWIDHIADSTHTELGDVKITSEIDPTFTCTILNKIGIRNRAYKSSKQAIDWAKLPIGPCKLELVNGSQEATIQWWHL